jgi:hypothetical protein
MRTKSTHVANPSLLSGVVGFGILLGTVFNSSAAPQITVQPAMHIICAGTNVVLNVGAVGIGAVSYQWQVNRTNLIGQTTGTLVLNNIQPVQQGHYRVLVTDQTGTPTSDEGLVVVLFPPTFVGQPTSVSVRSGESATFSAIATGKESPTLQWRLNGFPIAGATNRTYSVGSASTANAGNYDCVANNSCGTTLSTGAALTVDAPPLIVTNPTSQTVLLGTTVSFTVTSSGSAPLSYRWCKNGVDIPGAIATTLTIPNAQFSDEANYTAKATNPRGTATSQPATLTINGAPVITLQPVDHGVMLGAMVTFRSQATGRLPLTYQWCKNGVNIPGATSTNLTLANITSSDFANYNMKASNTQGAAASNPATLSLSTRVVRVANVQTDNFNSGNPVPVTVSIAAEGGENRVTFNLSYDSNLLTITGLSNRVTGATATLTPTGILGLIGIDWQLANSGQLSAGNSQLLDVLFVANVVTNQSLVFLPVEETPVSHVFGTAGQNLGARFIGGSVVFLAAGQTMVRFSTGFTEETIAFSYPVRSQIARPFPSIELANLGVDTRGDAILIKNATITNANNNPVIIVPAVLQPGDVRLVRIEYDVSDRITRPTPLVILQDDPGTFPTIPTGGTEIPPLNSVFFDDTQVLDYSSTVGKTYYAQYRTMGTTTWETSFPPMVGEGGPARWVDIGLPRTPSVPTVSGARQYRILEF